MIQGLEQHWQEVSQMLIENFSFLPRWKIEDVMATLGRTGANCGPHFDHYDVFLVQVCGQKKWLLDDGNHVDEDLDTTAQVRLLAEFDATYTEQVERGDVLYIPPGVGHWGIAQGTSVTLSVGLRNPTLPELVSHLADRVMDRSDMSSTLDEAIQSSQGGITDTDIENLSRKLAESLLNPKLLADWYGTYLTEPREPELITGAVEMSVDKIAGLLSDGLLSDGQAVTCTLASRLAYHENAGVMTIFVNGESVESSTAVTPWFTTLCSERRISVAEITRDHASIRLVQYLFAVGAIVIEEKQA